MTTIPFNMGKQLQLYFHHFKFKIQNFLAVCFPVPSPTWMRKTYGRIFKIKVRRVDGEQSFPLTTEMYNS